MPVWLTELLSRFAAYLIAAAVLFVVVGGFLTARCLSDRITQGGTDVKVQIIPVPDRREFNDRKLPERKPNP